MNKSIFVAVSHLNNKTKVEGVFSCYEFADKFCEIENSKIEEFRKADEGFEIKSCKLDSRKIPDNQCYKKHWDYIVNIDKDVQEFGQIRAGDTGHELVHVNKLQDVEIYNGEFIYCRSYVSKQDAENIAKEQWQMYEQKQAIERIA